MCREQVGAPKATLESKSARTVQPVPTVQGKMAAKRRPRGQGGQHRREHRAQLGDNVQILTFARRQDPGILSEH